MVSKCLRGAVIIQSRDEVLWNVSNLQSVVRLQPPLLLRRPVQDGDAISDLKQNTKRLGVKKNFRKQKPNTVYLFID